MTSEIDPGEVMFKALFEKHSGTLGNYYSVTWEYRDREGDAEQKQLDAIRDFISTNPRLMDTSKSETLVCTDGMSQEELDNLDETIDSIKEKQQQKKLVLHQLDFDSGEKNEKLEKNPDVQCQKNILLTSLPRNEKNYIS